ncbi:DUF3343 domain-containing protein [uncultured Helicobacter sp.]|uniref:DUF3343 domain-containing protein n=1 Tax=uncultured Helicobacter sp. TaxID=175537 RepID=UPI001C3BE535|nr:DUF3343 domain-containing protein [Candidatus Helicobacter avicola]
MENNTTKGYLLFFTTASAFESETLLKSLKVTFKLTPTPREFSSDCGIAIYFEVADITLIKSTLHTHKIAYDLHLLED